MRSDRWFAEKLKEKLEQRGIKCEMEEGSDPRAIYLICDYKLPWDDYYNTIQELTRELGGKFHDMSPDEDQCWLVVEFKEDTIHIEAAADRKQIEFDIYSEKLLFEEENAESQPNEQ